MNYYNEIDPFAAQWLRNLIEAGLIPKGYVDERSIVEVDPESLRAYTQCHFFAGIGGWAYALQLAGWPEDRPVWTGSCPCQPFSVAGKGAGEGDSRHLWPAFRRLISEYRPSVCFGEQVASKDGRLWLAGVRVDLEELGYAVGAADLCAAGCGAPHIRQRLYWVANPNPQRCGREGLIEEGKAACWERKEFERLVQDEIRVSIPAGKFGAVSDGVSKRTPKLRGYGNAIVPQVAAEFIGAFLDTIGAGKKK